MDVDSGGEAEDSKPRARRKKDVERTGAALTIARRAQLQLQLEQLRKHPFQPLLGRGAGGRQQPLQLL